MIEVRTPANQFFDTDGTPLDNGYIYVGTTGANPETTPQAVYWDKDGTIPAAQPIRTINGFPARDGAVSKFYTSTKNYSITVKDKRGILVMGVLNSDSGIFDELSDTTGAAGVGYDNATSGLAATDVQAAIDEVQANVDAAEASITSLSSSFSGLINLFANSAFIINTRGYASGTVTTTANQYTLDRIRVVVSGQSLIYSLATSGFGQKITAPAGGAEQVIEGSRITGGDYACNWTGTGTVQVNGTVRAKNETFTLTAGVNATVRMVGEIENIIFSRPELTGRYEYDHVKELFICQRYARKNTAGSGVTISTTALAGVAIAFDNPMRATPTATISNGTNTVLDPSVANRNLTAIATNGVTANGGYLDLTIAASTNNKLHTLIPGAILFTAEI